MSVRGGAAGHASVSSGGASFREAGGFCTDPRHALPCPLPCAACAAGCATEAGVTVTMTIGAALLGSLGRIAFPTTVAH
jgi:hypothetical protein